MSNEENWKFKRGDIVLVDSKNKTYIHGKKAVVTELSQNGYESYVLMRIDNGSSSAWYDATELTFIEHIDESGILEIEKAKETRQNIEKQLPWIVEHWAEIKGNTPGASMETLMALIGITEPWGSHGEGIVYWNNMGHVYRLLGEVLLTGDIEQVKRRAQEIRTTVDR